MRLVDLVELVHEPLDRRRLEEREPLGRQGVDLRQLLRHLQRQRLRHGLADDAAPDRLALQPLHHERLAPVDVLDVRDGPRHLDAGLVRRLQDLELVPQRERVPVDHAAARAPDEQPLAAGVDCPRLLRRPARQQHRLGDRAEDRLECLAHVCDHRRCGGEARARARVHGGARLPERTGAHGRGRRSRRAHPRAAAEGQGRGPLGAAPAAGGGRLGQRLPRVRRPQRGDRPQLHRAADLRLPGAGRRQRRDPPPLRHRRAEGALPRAARRRRGAFLLRHDRAGGGGLRPDAPAWARRARRRRVGDRRAQVVLVGSRRRGVRDRDGRDRARRRPAPACVDDPRPDRHARLRARAPRPGDGPRGPRLGDALRDALHRRARAAREHARRAGRRLPDRAEAARAGADPPRHALARADAACLRAHVRAGARARGVTAGRSPRSRRSRTGSPSRPPTSRRAG